MLQKLAALSNTPLYARLISIIGCLGFLHQVDQLLGNVDAERAGQQVNLTFCRHRFQAGDDGHIDARSMTTVEETEIAFVVEEHLRDDIVGPSIDLTLQVLDVGV